MKEFHKRFIIDEDGELLIISDGYVYLGSISDPNMSNGKKIQILVEEAIFDPPDN